MKELSIKDLCLVVAGASRGFGLTVAFRRPLRPSEKGAGLCFNFVGAALSDGLRCRFVGTAAADVERQVVEGFEGVAVADADDDALGQAAAQGGVEVGFGGLVQRGGGFVEEDGGGAGEEDAGEGDALLFAGGKPLLPVVFLVEQGDEVGEAAGFEGGGNVGAACLRRGVADGLQEAALRHIGFLRHEHDVFLRRADDAAAAAEGPESGEGA